MGVAPLNLLSLPIGADPENDPTVAWDELGRPVKRSMFGNEYLIELQPAPPNLQQSLASGYNSLVSNPGGTIGNMALNALAGTWEAVKTPYNALQGKNVTYGDVTNTLGLMTGVGAGMAAPQGALRSGAMRVWHGGNGDPMAAAADGGAWFSMGDSLAREYAGPGGKVVSADISPKNPISFRHAEQRRTIGDVISTALEGATPSANLDAARAYVEKLTARYGDEAKPLFEFWNKDKDVAGLFRSLGYDAISAAEKADMKAQTWGVLDPSIIKPAFNKATGNQR